MFKVIVNSVPHSCNHLVTNVLSCLGYNHSIINFTFYAVKPCFRRNQKAGIDWRTTRQLGNIARWRSELSAEEKLLSKEYLSDVLVPLNYQIV